MKNLFVLCLLCLFYYCINAQNRVRSPPQRMQRRQPPPRVLNRVQPASYSRSRVQQQAIRTRTQNKQRGRYPSINRGQRRIKPATVRGYWDSDWCIDEPFGIFVHDDCDKYWWCDDDGTINEGFCPDDAPIFDFEFFECAPEDWGWCWAWNDGEWDAECPEDPNELRFLRGDDCDSYYICINGWPVQWQCAPEQHWNEERNFCDIPSNAGCDPNAAVILRLPDCVRDGTLPHPTDCNSFIYCQKNGSRLIQKCPHLQQFNATLGRCVVQTQAHCDTQNFYRG